MCCFLMRVICEERQTRQAARATLLLLLHVGSANAARCPRVLANYPLGEVRDSYCIWLDYTHNYVYIYQCHYYGVLMANTWTQFPFEEFFCISFIVLFYCNVSCFVIIILK